MKTFVELVTEIKKSFDQEDNKALANIEDSMESTTVATSNHALGSYLIYDKKLYEVTTAISVGDTLVIYPGTGYNIKVADDLMTIIQTLANQVGTNTNNISLLNIAVLNKADSSTVTALDTAVNNKHKVTQLTVDTSSWVSDTTSQSGTTLYKKSIALNHVYVDSPSVDIGSTGVLPTNSEQESYRLLKYVTVDSTIPCLYLYSGDIPETAFYINVTGVD